MKDFDRLIEVLGSPVRLKIIQALSSRPRSLGEISSNLGVTAQAVLKHMRLLEESGIVSSTKLGRGRVGLVRQIYQLKIPFDIEYEERNGIRSLHMFSVDSRHPLLRTSGRSIDEGGSFIDLLSRLDEERYFLERRLRSLRSRESHIFEDVIRNWVEKRRILKDHDITPIDELLLEAYFSKDLSEEIRLIAKILRVEVEKIKERLRRLIGEEADIPT